jgi:hypothetical protein
MWEIPMIKTRIVKIDVCSDEDFIKELNKFGEENWSLKALVTVKKFGNGKTFTVILQKEDIDTHQLREIIADEMHNIWIHWMEYFTYKMNEIPSFRSTLSELYNSKSGLGITELMKIRQNPQVLIISKDDWDRWKRQMETPYSELTEKEKNSNRNQADKIIKLLGL